MVWSSPRTWVTNEIVTAAHMNQEVRDNLNAILPDAVTTVDWDPTLEATTSSATPDAVNGAEYQVGALQFGWVRWSAVGGIGNTNFGSGTYSVTLPSTAAGVTVSTSSGTVIGTWRAVDSGGAVANHEVGALILASATTARFGRDAGGTLASSHLGGFINLVLSCQFVYPTA